MLYFFNTKYHCHDRLPVFIGSKQADTLPTAEVIRSLWTGGLDEIPEQDVYEDIEAESVLAATEPKELCHSFLREFPEWDEVPDVTTELWNTGSHVLIYKHSHDDSKLVRLPAEDPGHVIELLKEILDDDREES
ncbi:MAG: hypothetical protein WCJ35_23410 [Planctomycetota bacterium]